MGKMPMGNESKPRKAVPACVTEHDVFATRLRETMEKRKLNQAQLTRLVNDQGCDMQRQTISLYMNGQSKPDVGRLAILCQALNISSDYLLGLSDHESLEENQREAADYLGITDSAAYTFHKLPQIGAALSPLCEIPGDLAAVSAAIVKLRECAAYLTGCIASDDYDYDYSVCEEKALAALTRYELATRRLPEYQEVLELSRKLQSPEELAIARLMEAQPDEVPVL